MTRIEALVRPMLLFKIEVLETVKYIGTIQDIKSITSGFDRKQVP